MKRVEPPNNATTFPQTPPPSPPKSARRTAPTGTGLPTPPQMVIEAADKRASAQAPRTPWKHKTHAASPPLRRLPQKVLPSEVGYILGTHGRPRMANYDRQLTMIYGDDIGRRTIDRRSTIWITLSSSSSMEGYAAVSYRRVAKGIRRFNQCGSVPLLVHRRTFRRRARRGVGSFLEDMANEIQANPTRALHIIWGFNHDLSTTALHLEYLALTNHRDRIRIEMEQLGHIARQVQLDALTERGWSSLDFDTEDISPDALLFVLIGIPQMMLFDRAIGRSILARYTHHWTRRTVFGPPRADFRGKETPLTLLSEHDGLEEHEVPRCGKGCQLHPGTDPCHLTAMFMPGTFLQRHKPLPRPKSPIRQSRP